jgi:hypothetical protein
MSEIHFHLVSKSEEPGNNECTCTWSIDDKKIVIDFKDSKDAFQIDSLLRIAHEKGYQQGKKETKASISRALSQI